MLIRRYLAAAMASVMMITGVLASAPAAARDYLQCVPFARAESGVEIRGNAKTWWAQAAGTYQRGEEPRQGAVMAFAGTGGMPLGHVAVVKKIVSDREILIDHANWSPINGRRGQIEFEPEQRDQPACNSSAQVGADDDSDGVDQWQDSGACERHNQQANHRAVAGRWQWCRC